MIVGGFLAVFLRWYCARLKSVQHRVRLRKRQMNPSCQRPHKRRQPRTAARPSKKIWVCACRWPGCVLSPPYCEGYVSSKALFMFCLKRRPRYVFKYLVVWDTFCYCASAVVPCEAYRWSHVLKGRSAPILAQTRGVWRRGVHNSPKHTRSVILG